MPAEEEGVLRRSAGWVRGSLEKGAKAKNRKHKKRQGTHKARRAIGTASKEKVNGPGGMIDNRLPRLKQLGGLS